VTEEVRHTLARMIDQIGETSDLQAFLDGRVSVRMGPTFFDEYLNATFEGDPRTDHGPVTFSGAEVVKRNDFEPWQWEVVRNA